MSFPGSHLVYTPTHTSGHRTPIRTSAHSTPSHGNGTYGVRVQGGWTGTPTQSTSEQRCTCCPYGHHVDLGFVNFAEQAGRGSPGQLSRVQRYQRTLEHSPGAYPVDEMSQSDVMELHSTHGTGNATRQEDHFATYGSVLSSMHTETVPAKSTQSMSSSRRLDVSQNHTPLKSQVQPHEYPSNNQTTSYTSHRTVDVTDYAPSREDMQSQSLMTLGSAKSTATSPENLVVIREQMTRTLRRVQELEGQVRLIPQLRQTIEELLAENSRFRAEQSRSAADDTVQEVVEEVTQVRRVPNESRGSSSSGVVREDISILQKKIQELLTENAALKERERYLEYAVTEEVTTVKNDAHKSTAAVATLERDLEQERQKTEELRKQNSGLREEQKRIEEYSRTEITKLRSQQSSSLGTLGEDARRMQQRIQDLQRENARLSEERHHFESSMYAVQEQMSHMQSQIHEPKPLRSLSCQTQAVSHRTVGMNVQPTVREVGLNVRRELAIDSETSRTEEKGLTQGALDVNDEKSVMEWMQSSHIVTTQYQKSIIQKLVQSFHQDRSEFVNMIVRMLAKNVKSQYAQAKPEIRSVGCEHIGTSLTTRGVGDHSVELPLTFSREVTCKPSVTNKYASTDKKNVYEAATNTSRSENRDEASTVQVSTVDETSVVTQNDSQIDESTITDKKWFDTIVQERINREIEEKWIKYKSEKEKTLRLEPLAHSRDTMIEKTEIIERHDNVKLGSSLPSREETTVSMRTEVCPEMSTCHDHVVVEETPTTVEEWQTVSTVHGDEVVTEETFRTKRVDVEKKEHVEHHHGTDQGSHHHQRPESSGHFVTRESTTRLAPGEFARTAITDSSLSSRASLALEASRLLQQQSTPESRNVKPSVQFTYRTREEISSTPLSPRDRARQILSEKVSGSPLTSPPPTFSSSPSHSADSHYSQSMIKDQHTIPVEVRTMSGDNSFDSSQRLVTIESREKNDTSHISTTSSRLSNRPLEYDGSSTNGRVLRVASPSRVHSEQISSFSQESRALSDQNKTVLKGGSHLVTQSVISSTQQTSSNVVSGSRGPSAPVESVHEYHKSTRMEVIDKDHPQGDVTTSSESSRWTSGDMTSRGKSISAGKEHHLRDVLDTSLDTGGSWVKERLLKTTHQESDTDSNVPDSSDDEHVAALANQLTSGGDALIHGSGVQIRGNQQVVEGHSVTPRSGVVRVESEQRRTESSWSSKSGQIGEGMEGHGLANIRRVHVEGDQKGVGSSWSSKSEKIGDGTEGHVVTPRSGVVRVESEQRRTESSWSSKSGQIGEGAEGHGMANIRRVHVEGDRQGAGSSWSFKPGQQNRERFELSKDLKSACRVFSEWLKDSTTKSSKEMEFDSKTNSCLATVRREWFEATSKGIVDPAQVEDYLIAFRDVSPILVDRVVNMEDDNGNTALHYAVSHGCWPVVSLLLDTGKLDVNKVNRKGYSPVMLVALTQVDSADDKAVVKRLLSKCSVDQRSSSGDDQTALMLASDHGNAALVSVLLELGSSVNMRDTEGATALMYAAEKGHMQVVKVLLARPDTDANLCDNEGNTAFQIAQNSGHQDIALLIYARTHLNRSPGSPGSSGARFSSPTTRRVHKS